MSTDRLPTSVLESYRIEYETTPIQISELCEKYDLTTKQLRGYTKWEKDVLQVADNFTEADIVSADTKLLPQTSATSEATLADGDIPDDKLAEMKAKIVEAKELAIDSALHFFKGDGAAAPQARFAEVKEFKDMVSIIDTIDKSLEKKRDTGGATHIVLIQNIMREFGDDC